jgi:hypothetical protein
MAPAYLLRPSRAIRLQVLAFVTAENFEGTNRFVPRGHAVLDLDHSVLDLTCAQSLGSDRAGAPLRRLFGFKRLVRTEPTRSRLARAAIAALG